MKSNREKALEYEKIVEDQIQTFGTEEDIVIENIEELTNEDLYQIIKGIDSVTSNMRKLKKALGSTLSGNLYNSAKRIGDDIIVGKPKFTWKPYNKDKVIDYLGEDWKEVINPSFRITGIQAIARKRGQDPWVILESLFEQVETPGVNILPSFKAPKYMQELEDGEIINLDKRGENTNE
mgnify:CR=1 FL=1|tara:strand:+ start:159 stop:695 length:537 start_codon:yes stop_codon:yes gene_type:complete